MVAFLASIFGASLKTSLMGLLGGMFYYFNQAGITFPTDAAGWKTAIVAAGIYSWGRMMKDHNISNASNPAPAGVVSAFLVPVMLIGLISCSATQIQKDQAVVLKLKADAHTVLITGCANLPVMEVLLSTVLEFVPAGTDKDKVTAGVATYGPQATALCAKLTATPAVAPVPAPTAGTS